MPKYLRKEFRNGRTVYIYPEDEQGSSNTKSNSGSSYSGPKLTRGKSNNYKGQQELTREKKQGNAPLAKQFKSYKRKQAIKKRINDIVSRLREKVKSATGAVKSKAKRLYRRAKLLARRLKPVRKSESTSASVSKKPATMAKKPATMAKKQLNTRKD